MLSYSQIHYFPALQSSDAEHIAYRNLSDEDKDNILPIFEITQIKTGSLVNDAIDKIRTSSSGRAFVLDLSYNPAPDIYVPSNEPAMDKIHEQQIRQDEYNARIANLLDPQNGFQNWRELCAELTNSIPIIQFTDALKQSNNILRQASMLSKTHHKLAIRITDSPNKNLFQVIGRIIAVLEKPSDLLIILDAGQGRIKKENRADFAKKAISKTISEVEPSQVAQLEFVFLYDSYSIPKASPILIYPNYAWELWDEVNSEFSISFGDYSAHKRMNRKNTFIPGDWKATVVYPLDEMWLVYKDPNNQDADGWIRGAKTIFEREEFVGYPECWGGKILHSAVEGDISSASSAKFWHAAKINMHIHQQIQYSIQRFVDSV